MQALRNAYARAGVATTLALAPVLSMAAADPETAAIAGAETRALAIAASLLVLSVGVWAGMYIKRRFFG